MPSPKQPSSLVAFRNAAILSLALLGLPARQALGGQQAGPNPSNLSPDGSQGVSLFTGAFTYSYPIEVPPGRRGIQPELKLLYDSQAQNGWLGKGWNLSLGSIQRSTKNGMPTYIDSQDTFVLQFDGKTEQLAFVSSGTDARGSYSEYRAQIESLFLRSRYYAPSLWVATSKDGTQHEFQGLAQNTSNSQYFYWGLTKKFDPLGNFMAVSYPSLSSATTSGAPGPGGTPTAIISSRAVVGFMPASIGYTGRCTPGTCQAVSESTTTQITFSYELRPDTLESWLVGAEQKITTRLKTIQTTSNGNPVRTYQLTYGTNTIGGSLLTNITFLGSDGASSLSTTTFSYSDNTSYTTALSTSYSTFPINIANGVLVDVNGDGLPDMVSSTGSWLNTGDGWASTGSWAPPVALAQPVSLANVTGDAGVRFTDFNGDGLADILQGLTTTFGAWLNTGSGWSSAPSQWNPPAPFAGDIGFSSGTVLADVNGDGLPDILQGVKYKDFSNVVHDAIGAWLNTGNGWASTVTWQPYRFFYEERAIDVSPSPPDYLDYSFFQWDAGMRFGDFNGDGLVDLIYADAGISTGAWLNTGTDWVEAPQWKPPVQTGNTYRFHYFRTPTIQTQSAEISGDSGARVADINGDGLPDIVQYSTVPATVEHIWLSTGNGWLQNDAFAGALSSITTNKGMEFVDLNGDNVVDVIALSTNPASNRVYLGYTTPFGVLTSVNNGLGGLTQASYAFSPPPIQEGMHLPPVTVVRSVTKSSGISGNAVIPSSFAYSGGLVHMKRPYREFLGFQQVTTTDGQGNYSVTYFLQDQSSMSGVNLYKGIVSEESRYDFQGNLLTRSTYTVSFSTPFAGVYFPFVSQVDTHFGSKHSAKGSVYDSYGNLTRELDYGDVDLVGDERTLVATFSASTGPYLVGYPIAKQTFSGIGTTGFLLAQTSFYYDGSYTQSPTLGTLTKTTNMLSGGQDTVVVSSRDAYGNVTDTYDALYNATGGSQGNHIRTTYETTFHQFPQSVQQATGSALGLPAEAFTYDPGTGQMSSHVDMNGSTTTYTYDVFGRLASVVGPSDQVTSSSPTVTFQYNVSATPPHSIATHARVVHGSTMTLATYAFFDGLRRKIETKTATSAGNQLIDDMVLYDSMGLPATAYVPITRVASASYVAPGSTQPHGVTFYDGLGRIVRVVNPDNTVSTRAYQGWTETYTDANGHSKIFVKNAYGWITEVDEQDSTTTYATRYQYDMLGNLTGIVNSLDQGTTQQYDTLSRKTLIIDPVMGTWQYQYDPNGNLIQQTDSKNQAVTMTYDPLKRITFKVYPDSTTLAYFYDSGTFGKGRLSQVVDLSGSEQLAYDREGNVLSKTRTIGSGVFTTSMTYDALDRQTSGTYPDGIRIDDIYDGSVLSAVQSASAALSFATLTYSTAAPTKFGSVLYGNGMSAQFGYDPNMLRLSSLKTLASGSTIQHLGYQYDYVGNISQITDSVAQTTRTFAFDALDRLVQSTGPYGASSYEYDSIGNLLLNGDKSGGFWNFSDGYGVTAIQGLAVSTPGRVGNGLGFGGSSAATIDGSSAFATPGAITIALWLRPRALGSGYTVSRSSSYYFPRINSDGSLDAGLNLSSGEVVLHVSSASLLNLWRYYVMTYDGSSINVYVNGQLWAFHAASGSIQTSTQPVVLGSGLVGAIDELGVYPYALSAAQVMQRYQFYPELVLSEPYTPDSVPAGMTAGVVNTTYTFAFTAWDLNGGDLKYRIDWGSGPNEDTGYVPSGSTVQATHTWTSAGRYDVRVMAVQPSTASAWSPTCNILIVGTSVQARLDALLIGASANAGATSANAVADTAGEAATGAMSSAQTIAYLGYQSTSIAPSSWTPQYLGRQATGGTDAPPTAEMTASDLVQYSTHSVAISTIALNLLEHGATTFADANGNLVVANGRWIAYDYENRPVSLVTQDATLIQFAYDYEGSRTQQTVTPLGQSSQTTTYVGGIYELSSTSTIKYVNAGPLLVAMLSSAGTTTYFLPDHLGSTDLLVNSSLATVRSVRYMPFGGTFETSGTADNDHKFTGQRLDGSTGLYYYGARYYDPLSGRFITPDSLLQDPYDPQLLNRYAYARNNPVRLLDPDGHAVALALLPAGAAVYGAEAAWSSRGDLNAIGAGMSRGAMVGGSLALGAAYSAVRAGGALAGGLDVAWRGGGPAEIAAGALAGWASMGLLGSAARMGGGFGLSASVASQTSTLSSAQSGTYRTIGSTGKLGEQRLAEMLGGQPRAYFKTSYGARFVDQFAEGIANESKVGYTSLTQHVRLQVLKDVELMQTQRIQGATWHFFPSPVTGLGGPSQPLVDLLRQSKIDLRIY